MSITLVILYALAAMLAQQARICLLDEPLNPLDPRHQRRVAGPSPRDQAL